MVYYFSNTLSYSNIYYGDMKTDKNEYKNNYLYIRYIFYNCNSLQILPDISKWNTVKVNDMSYLFYGCNCLTKLPDISLWNKENVTNMSYMFYNCNSLKSLPDISFWTINNVKDISFMFSNCLSLHSLPDISRWNTSNIVNMDYLFSYCSLLLKLPEISNWKTDNLEHMENFFYDCNSLILLPDISKWNIRKANKNLKNIFPSSSSEIINNFLSSNYNNYESLKISYNSLFDEKNENIKDEINVVYKDYDNLFNNNSEVNELDDYYDNFYT